MKTKLFSALLGSVWCSVGVASPLVVHEWGTFTSFQDPEGNTIAGINVDDEPVPAFVHRLADLPVFATTSQPATWSQGAPRCHPDVTLRLETPVLYFYPPADWAPAPFDVQATFVGGWLTEFYPRAEAETGKFPARLQQDTRGSLLWRQMTLGASADAVPPETAEHVWLAPRNVRSTVVVNAQAGEAEKYLFYRGVGHLDAPLVVRERTQGWEIAPRDRKDFQDLPRIWLVEVLPDKRVRFESGVVRGDALQAPVFAPGTANTPSQLPELQRELSNALVQQGLYADEAAAMLDTWRLSYFESEGLRVFFFLPQAWTDARLPLSISTRAQTTRVMLGRIELVTARQRQTLARLESLSLDAYPRLPLYYHDRRVLQASGQSERRLSELYRFAGREVPEPLRLYESLGRFRDALVVHTLNATHDAARRARLERAISAYSACVPEMLPWFSPAPPAASAK